MYYSKICFRSIVFLVILFWCIGFSLKVLTNGSTFSIASSIILNFFYNNVCHQEATRIISFNGFSFLVCARCSGIYIGALISSLFILITFKKIKIPSMIFLTASVILLLDVIINNLILNFYSKISAFLTGILFGAVCFLIIINSIEVQILEKTKN